MTKVEKLTDLELAREMVYDNHPAFSELYRRYKHKVFQFISILSRGDYFMAEEIVQQTFILIWENRKKIKIEQSVANYLKVVSKNIFLKETAKRVQEELLLSKMSQNQVVSQNYVEEEIELKLLREEIERIVSQLPPARQKVYRLRYIEHLSQKEIAERLGISENTVEGHLRQSGQFMQQKLRTVRGDTLNGTITLISLLLPQLI